ncbi:MAG TPA: ABC transporter ATP-binding protein [Dissulfurispiraceae bacterium]|nr:ABC transporter ATP-binding protein [Dissulfurispiraceae bacterium]
MSNKLLEVKKLSISFRSDHEAMRVVSDVSFDIGEAEVFGLVGESGSGKSMTALSILRILPGNAFAEGRIMFRDKDLLALSGEEMRGVRGKDISIIFQEPMTSLNPVLTVGFQVAEALRTHFDMNKSEAMNSSIELLRSVKIPSPELRIKDYPHQLSGGMRQRVMIAMAIACNPGLLIADEPTTALDVTIQAQILDLLKRLRQDRKMAILLITHDLSIISEQAERVAVMYAGRIMELAGVEELFRNPMHPYTVGLLESLPDKKGIPLKPISGFVPSPDLYPEGCKFSDRCAAATSACIAGEPTLVEVSAGHFVRCFR